jgi:hypothetical protein
MALLPPMIYRSTLTPERRLGAKEQAHHLPFSRFAYQDQEFSLILASISSLTSPLVTMQFPTKDTRLSGENSSVWCPYKK